MARIGCRPLERLRCHDLVHPKSPIDQNRSHH
jgi:hypothetical protein